MKLTFTRKFPFVAHKAAPVDTFEDVMDDFFVARDRLEAVRSTSLNDVSAQEEIIAAANAKQDAALACAARAARARQALDNLLGMEGV